MLSFSILTSCQHIQIKDQEWCGDMGYMGASCFHTLTEKKRNIDPIGWADQRFGWLCTSPQQFGEMKSELLRLCNLSKKCTYEDERALEALDQKLETLENDRRAHSLN